MGWGRWLRVVVTAALGLMTVFTIWLSGPGNSLAEPQGAVSQDVTPTPAASASRSAEDISSEKISQFVQAYLQVLHLVEQREGMLQGAETQPEAQQLEREIAAQALKEIAASGLTWQEYLQLLGLANSDPEFGERIAAQLQEAE